MIYVMSGGNLNYKISVSATQPASPQQNTIWVKSSTAMTSHIFSATAPATPSAGMIWIKTASSSPAAFSALKRNTLMIYPITAKQYESGKWVTKEMAVYIGTAWVIPFDGRLYENGIFYADYTEQKNPDTAKIEYKGDRISVSTVANNTSEVYEVFGPVSLDNVDTITLTGRFSDAISGTHYARLFISTELGKAYADAESISTKTVSTNSTSVFTLTLDVSAATGLQYIYAGNTSGAWTYARVLEITGVSCA